MLDNIITLEGLFTYVLFTELTKDIDGNVEHKFITQSDGTTTAKTPMGCFSELYVPNDIFECIKVIDKYEKGE